MSGQEVTFTLPSSVRTGEAQNLETGETFPWDATESGPRFSHRFKPRDLLVLLIKK